MMQYDRMTLGKKSRTLGFVRDTFEKVCRLIDVLAFVQSSGISTRTAFPRGGYSLPYWTAPDGSLEMRCSAE